MYTISGSDRGDKHYRRISHTIYVQAKVSALRNYSAMLRALDKYEIKRNSSHEYHIRPFTTERN